MLKLIQAECCKDGARVENKGAVLSFHYRNVPQDKRPRLVSRVKELIEDAGFRVGLAHDAVESKPKVFWDKGRASIFILNNSFGKDWAQRYRLLQK